MSWSQFRLRPWDATEQPISSGRSLPMATAGLSATSGSVTRQRRCQLWWPTTPAEKTRSRSSSSGRFTARVPAKPSLRFACSRQIRPRLASPSPIPAPDETGMKIISCVPLPGAGVIARHGALVAVTDSHGQDPDPLLGVLTEIAAAGGDGRDLVRMAARAALGCPGQPAWACAGVTADDVMAVLVHGAAAATVSVDGAAGVALTASDSLLPVTRTFTGTSVSVGLGVGNPAAPDPRCWLGDGVVHGGGLTLTAVADASTPAVVMPETLYDLVPAQLTGGLPAEVTGSVPASDRPAGLVD